MFPDLTRDDVFRLETKRLWLRWPRATDAAAITSFAALPGVAQMTAGIPHPYPAQEADRFILKARAENAAGQALHLSLTRKTGPRRVIGSVSVTNSAGEAEIGYMLAPDVWGKGFATEAMRIVVTTIFALTPAARIKSNSRVCNTASRRVLEKCGFAYVDTGLDLLAARGGMYPCDRFRLERADWRHACDERRLPPMSQQNDDGSGTLLTGPIAQSAAELHEC